MRNKLKRLIPTFEWSYIFIFCTTYAIIANIESRMFPVESSIAERVRVKVYFEIDKVNRDEEYEECKNTRVKIASSNTIVFWYYDEEKYEYWCGLSSRKDLFEKILSHKIKSKNIEIFYK